MTTVLDDALARTLVRTYRPASEVLLASREERASPNRLVRVRTTQGEEWVLKQSFDPTDRIEFDYYERNAGEQYLPTVVFLDRASGVIATEVPTQAGTLHTALTDSPRASLVCLHEVARQVAAVHSRPIAQRRGPLRRSRLPLPQLDPIDVDVWAEASAACLQILSIVQDTPSLGDCLVDAAWDADSPQSEIHGDLKLDNILVLADGVVILDWETAGLGPTAADLGAVIGSIIGRWSDSREASIAGQPNANGAIALDSLRAAVGLFLTSYSRTSEGDSVPVPTVAHVATHAAAWLVARTWADCCFRHVPTASDLARLMVAQAIIEDPSALFEEQGCS